MTTTLMTHPSLDRFRTAARTGDVSSLTYRGEPVVSAMAAGLREEEIETLRGWYLRGKIRDEFRVRRGYAICPLQYSSDS